MNRKPFEIPNIITIDEAADKINEFLAGSKTEIILRFAYGYYIKLKKHIKKSAPYIEIHTSGYDDTLPSGAKLRLQIDGAEAKDIKQLDEFFQVFAEAVKVSDETDIELVIENPNDEDALVKELRK